jgi:hypothetical protein
MGGGWLKKGLFQFALQDKIPLHLSNLFAFA